MSKPRTNICQTGDLVRVTYKKQSGNYQWGLWEMTAIFLSSNPKTDETNFSLRPVMGSTMLSSKWNPIQTVEVIMNREEVQKLGGIRAPGLGKFIKLPRRLERTTAPAGL